MHGLLRYLLTESFAREMILLSGKAKRRAKREFTEVNDRLSTFQLVDVKTVSGITGGKVATAQWPLGYPTIVIDESAFVKLPKNAKQFIYYHECAHLTLNNKDEYVADCESINILLGKHGYSELNVRKLIQTLSQEFGWSRCWQELLNCERLQP